VRQRLKAAANEFDVVLRHDVPPSPASGAQKGVAMIISTMNDLPGYRIDEVLGEGREHATQRLVEEAEGKGANAVIAFRFDTSELGSTWTEICAYGTAVRVTRGE